MENESSTTVHGGTNGSGKNMSYSSILQSSPSSSFLNYQSDGGDFTALEREMMMMSPSHHSDFLDDLHHHQDLMDRQNTVLSYMKETAKQAQALRQENINLKMANAELTNRLSLLIKATSDYAASSFGFSGLDPGVDVDSVLNGLNGLGMVSGGRVGEGSAWSDVAADGDSPSPTSVMDSGGVEGSGDGIPGRVLLPKSISVRSTGYLKPGQAGGSSGGRVNKVLNHSKSWDEAQRVHVRGGKKQEQPLELEVYNQGMFKTELCNKWQETGACPYGDHCQFAHGIQELRPVLRHPRYKTEVCRMVLNGDHCPYGHRCHFRHTLTDQEKIIRSINLRSLKVLNR